jgi:hypothetical protein
MVAELLVILAAVSGPLQASVPQADVDVIWAAGLGLPPPGMSGAQARLMARRAAEVRAVRNLTVKLGYGRRTTIRGFRYVSTTYRSDGSIRVVVTYTRPQYSGSDSRQPARRLRYEYRRYQGQIR